MSCSEFQGYGKPLLRMKDGELIVTNTPVPRGGYLFPRLFQHRDLLEKLALMRVARRLASDSGEVSSNIALGGLTLMGGCKTEDSEIVAIVREMLVDLKETTRRKHSELVLVHLPMPFDINKKVSARWERVIADQAGDLDIPYVDLIPDLQRLPRERVMELIPGHFSAEGNRHFANAMYRRFMEIPQLAARLSPRE